VKTEFEQRNEQIRHLEIRIQRRRVVVAGILCREIKLKKV